MTNADFLEASFKAHTEGETHLTRRMVIKIAHANGLTPRQCVLGLERAGLCKKGSWDWFAENGGITRAQIDEVMAGDA